MNKLKVGLVFAKIPYIASESLQHEQLGLAYLAGSLSREQYEYAIIDGNVFNLSAERIADQILNEHFDLVGFSVLYPNFEETQKIIDIIHDKNPSIIIILGGQHVTFCDKEILENQDKIFGIIRGEGEFILIDLLKELIKKEHNYDRLEGFSYQISGKFHRNVDRIPEKDLEKYEKPVHDVLEEALNRGIDCSLNILASRGCLYNCSFCNGNQFFNPTKEINWRVRPVSSVVDELEVAISKYGQNKSLYDIVNFCDLNFINCTQQGREWLQSFIGEIRERNIDFYFYVLTRVDSITKNMELVKELRNIGLAQIEIGLESGSASGLNTYNKNISVSQSKEAVDFLRKLRIDISSSGFIMFNPFTTVQELRENAIFLKDIQYWKVSHLVTRAGLFPMTPLTQTCLERKLTLDSFNHFNVYDYRFIDKDIDFLFNQLLSVNFDALSPVCTNVTFIMFKMILNYRKIEKLNILNTEELNEKITIIENDLNLIIQENQKEVFNFFMSVLNLLENGWSQKEFDRIKYVFTRAYFTRGRTISEYFTRYIKHMEDFIGELVK